MEPNKKDDPVLWEIKPFQIPDYSIEEENDKEIEIISGDNILTNSNKTSRGVIFDINRVSSRNARKSELGPYRNSFLREIISSNNMGKASGTKNELVATILNYVENQSK
jgi:hypothetical protein